jgi:hypothetical protein
MNIESTMVLFAVVTALGLVTVVVVDIMLTAQEAEGSRGVHLLAQEQTQVKEDVFARDPGP